MSLQNLDLSQVLELRIEGNTQGAIEILRSLNEKHPTSVEVLSQLGRALIDSEQYSLAAFRFEQALSLNPDKNLAMEAAEAHYLAQDFESAIERYRYYLSSNPLDFKSRLIFARLLAGMGNDTEALNSFTQASEDATAEDSLLMGDLFLKKNLFTQAKHWYGESSRRKSGSPTLPLLGLLRVAKAENNGNDAETIILALEKSEPGILDQTDLAEFSTNLLTRRRLADFISRGMDTRGKSISELASGLLAGNMSSPERSQSVTSKSKLPPRNNENFEENNEPEESNQSSSTMQTAQSNPPQKESTFSLADAFAAPIGEVQSVAGAFDPPIDLGKKAYLNGSYTSALLHARDALKENSKDAYAWQLCSQAHFQLGETNQAEMTILEAIRHQPLDLDMRMDYLRIARETLSSKRYLQELEKVHDIFPDSTEILWELARRYHMVENMPVTAAVLYRKITEIASSDSPLADQAKMELIKLKDL